MKPHKIIFKPSVEKDLRGLPDSIVTRVLAAIEKLEFEQFPTGVTKLEGSDMTFRIRLGDYRIIYRMDKSDRVIEILYVRHRREAYRKM
jgi:mRNA interferase RelE/StbE